MSLSKKKLRKCISKCLEGIMNKGDIHYIIIMYKKTSVVVHGSTLAWVFPKGTLVYIF